MKKVKTSKHENLRLCPFDRGGTIRITETPHGFAVTYHATGPKGRRSRALPGRTTSCSSIRSAKAAVTRFRNKYGEPDAFDVEQELWEKLNIPLV